MTRAAAHGGPGRGAEAARALLEAVFAGRKEHAVSPLQLSITTSASTPGRDRVFAGSAAEGVSRLTAVEAEVGAKRLEAELRPRLGRYVEDAKNPGLKEYAISFAALQLEVDLVRLFAPGGPLDDPTVVTPTGDYVEGHPTVGDLRRGEAWLRKALPEGPFPPTAVLALGTTFRLLYALRPEIRRNRTNRNHLDQLAGWMATLLHGAVPVWPDELVPLPVGRAQAPGTGAPVRLLWTDPRQRYHPRRLYRRVRAFFEVAEPETDGRGRRRPPLAMRMRTLPEGWALEDMDIPARWRSYLAGESSPGGLIVLDDTKEFVRTMARWGYAWEDVVLLLRDRRYRGGRTMKWGADSEAGIRRTFRKALPAGASAHPRRLPYGIRRMGRLREPEPASTCRYVVEGGSRTKPFRIVVSHDVLTSASRIRRALGAQIGLHPYPVTAEVWDGVIREALLDPRITRDAKAPTEPPALSSLIRRFAQGAADWNGGLGHDEDAETPQWPVRRDGGIVFPLKGLRTYLAANMHGPAPSQGEVTALVRELGGGPSGTMRFGPWGVRRVWTLPGSVGIPPRPRRHARRPGHAIA